MTNAISGDSRSRRYATWPDFHPFRGLKPTATFVQPLRGNGTSRHGFRGLKPTATFAQSLRDIADPYRPAGSDSERGDAVSKDWKLAWVEVPGVGRGVGWFCRGWKWWRGVVWRKGLYFGGLYEV